MLGVVDGPVDERECLRAALEGGAVQGLLRGAAPDAQALLHDADLHLWTCGPGAVCSGSAATWSQVTYEPAPGRPGELTTRPRSRCRRPRHGSRAVPRSPRDRGLGPALAALCRRRSRMSGRPRKQKDPGSVGAKPASKPRSALRRRNHQPAATCGASAHFSSMRPFRQTGSAATQVTTRSPTTAWPTLLRLMSPIRSQKTPCRESFSAAIDSSSTVPMRRAAATGRPVIVMP